VKDPNCVLCYISVNVLMFDTMKRSRQFCILLLVLLGTFFSLGEESFGQSAALSKDYWVSYLPSKRPQAAVWLLMCTNVPNTKVEIIYTMDSNTYRDNVTISPGNPKEYKIINDNGYLAKPTKPEVVEARSVHIISSNPISLQGFTDENNNVGLFLALPTSSLGQKYVIAAYNDQPFIAGNCLNCFDSSSSAFVITAIEDNTSVTIHANSPTKGGHKAGDTWTVNLGRGQTYWVQGAALDDQDDLSKSTVTATKPVAVIAGCEIMRALDAMVIQGHFDYNDYIVEQMIPVEAWGTDYVSAPFTNKRGTKYDVSGDLYRVFATEPTNIIFNGRQQALGTYWEFPLTTDPVHITSDKPIMVVQYDYYVDFHFANEPRTSNSEMVLVPRHNWRKNATFKVPTGYALTYFAVAAHKDSIEKIMVQTPGAVLAAPIGSLPPGLKYYAGDYAIRVVQLSKQGQAVISGPCDFAVYNYGTRDDDNIKATYGYASAAAASFGSISNSTPPKMKKDSTCVTFNVTLTDSSDDGRGIGDMYLLNDPKGLTYRNTPYVSTNVALNIDKYSFGSKTVTAHVTVVNALLDAFAALYVTNRAGKDTVFTFTYSGVQMTTKPDSAAMLGVLFGSSQCTDYTLTNNGKKAFPIEQISFQSATNHMASAFTLTTSVPLPTIVKPGQTITIHVCYTPTDIDVLHTDTLQVVTACYAANLAAVLGSGDVPIIYSNNAEFGNVVVGYTSCTEKIRIENKSFTKDMVLTKNLFFNSPVFSLDPVDLARLPITLKPQGFVLLTVCYTPKQAGYDTTQTLWGSNIPMPYTHNLRDISILTGHAVKAGVNWDLNAETGATVCTRDTTFALQLVNSGDAVATIDSLRLAGPDAAEFTIVKVGSQATFDNFPLTSKSQLPVLVKFVANTSGANPWRVRRASMLVYSFSGTKDTEIVNFTSSVSHPVLTANAASLDFGETDPGTTLTSSFKIDNLQGSSPLTIQDWTVSDPTFTVTGITKGQVLQTTDVVTITAQANSAVPGKFTGTLTLIGSECAGSIQLPMVANFASRQVTATGAQYDTTWTCESNQNFVTFCNRGSKPVKLTGVQISGIDFNGSKSMNSDQFVFGNPGGLGTLASDSLLLVSNGGITLKQDSCIDIKVLFNASKLGPASAVATFLYDSGDGRTLTLDRHLTANAKNLPVTISTVQPSALPYTDFVDKVVNIPIEIKEDLSTGNIYGYDFDVKFNSDMFDIVRVDPGPMGYPIIMNSGQIKSNDTNYVVLHVRAMGTSQIAAGQHMLANVVLATKLAKQDTTAIIPMNLQFFRKDGSSICYTPFTPDPSLYIQQKLCGEATIQKQIGGGLTLVNLLESSPNPFKGSTNIHFLVNRDKTPVTVEVFNELGLSVAKVVDGVLYNKGDYSVRFDASQIPSGTYYCRVSGGEAKSTWTESSRLILSK
jgi:hypothetical protein